MIQASLPRALWLTNDVTSAHAARELMRRAALHLVLEEVSTRKSFLSALHRSPLNLILAGKDGLPGLTLAEVLEQASNAAPSVPLVVLGSDGMEDEALDALRGGASDYLRASQLDRLPVVLERALREQEAVHLTARLRDEIRNAADAMRESQKMVTIGRLTASIAHEINNPLESVTNLLYLIGTDQSLTDTTRSYLETAQKELHRVVEISKQTLSFYRESPLPVSVEMGALLEEVLILYSRRMMEKQITVEKEFATNLALTVFPGEMRQVFSNLIANAIEASQPGGRLRLRIHASRLWGDDGIQGVRIVVGDTGSGISRDARHRLGEPFFTTKGQRGTGLGLWVTQSIIQRYGGFLSLHSSTRAEKHGTVFSIFLPTNLRPMAVHPQEQGNTVSQTAMQNHTPDRNPRYAS